MMATIGELATVVRSKNCSPFELTLDVVFASHEDYVKVRDKRLISAKAIARAYGVPTDRVRDIICFDPADAVKVVMQRVVPSGAFGDTDVYGAQQHGPLLAMAIDL